MTHLQRPELDPAVRAGILSAEQADRLVEFFGAHARLAAGGVEGVG